MKKIYTLFIGLTLTFAAFAQMKNLGGPVSFNSVTLSDDSKVPTETMPYFDLERQLLEDAANQANKVGPYRFGFENITNFSLQNSGVWDELDNGDRIWRIKLASPGALSMNIIFNDFYIPEGAYVYLYNKKTNMVQGAYTSYNNNINNVLGSDLVKGEEVVIEYFEPSEVVNQGRLLIGMVVHGYRDINDWYPKTNKVNESGPCNMDVVCADGDPWWRQIRAVARILNGGGLCTGTMVNNTANDGTPYFLTANHCGPATMSGATFLFNYDSPICGSQTASDSQSSTGNVMNGSIFRAANADSDFGLVELNSVPPASYNVYYSGWNNSGDFPQTAVGIHHPSGDVKKISFDDDPLQSAQGLSSVANSEWRIEAWERLTTTEGGSSGSGLFDENQFLIGQLHGGQAACGNSINDYYGKFSMSWDGNGSSLASERLRDWLDPQNTGDTTLAGMEGNPTGIIELAEAQTGFSFDVYPNPATSQVSIQLNDTELNNLSITLMDVQGRIMFSSSNNIKSGSLFTMDLNGVSTGVYFIKVSSGNLFRVEKLIVE